MRPFSSSSFLVEMPSESAKIIQPKVQRRPSRFQSIRDLLLNACFRADSASPSSTRNRLSPFFKRKPKGQGAAKTMPSSSASPAIVVFSVLGIVGPFNNENAGRMVLDSLLFTTLLAGHPGFDRRRFRYRSIRDVTSLCPDNTFLFGEAGCDRLGFRLPQCLFDDHANPNFVDTAKVFVDMCCEDISASASQVQPGEQFLLVLIGHGQCARPTDEFVLCITTKSRRVGEAWLPKHRLENAVQNSCTSGALESPKWRLICAAGPTELADALATSASGNIRGSVSSLCALAEDLSTACKLSEIHHPTCGLRTVPILGCMESIQAQLHFLTPPFSSIRKSYRRDKQDDGLCQRFMHDAQSLAEGEIVDFCISLRTRHIQSVVVQLVSIRLGWCSTSKVTPFLSLVDAEPGERVIKDMVEEGLDVHEFLLRLLMHFDAVSSHGDRASVWWIAKVWDSNGRPKVSPEAWEEAWEEAMEEAAKLILVPVS
ncbi:hypothetical protein B0H11DRAFT_2279525 [Mycena galericulata]|nr:hypothetical protein B0H11DRAFT_2279525 [Mycena galericulata]